MTAIVATTLVSSAESRLATADGCRLFVRDWFINDISSDNVQPCIVILHGLGEHCGRYNHIAQFLATCGFAVRTYDHRGHGQSDGPRGDVPDAMSLKRDAEMIVRDFAGRCQTSPLLFGHSMGGLIAAHIATSATSAAATNAATSVTPPLRGLILSSPAFALRMTFMERVLLKMMSSVAPHFAVPSGLQPVYLSHKLPVVVAYVNDILVHNKVTASLINSMFFAIDFVQSHAPLLTVPTLLLVAEDDQLINPQGSYDFFDALPSNIGSAHFYPAYYHEVFNEIGASKVFDDLKSWLDARQFI